MKKILFLINSLAIGGAEKSLITLANKLNKSKYEVTVMTILDGGENKSLLEERVVYRTLIKTKNKFTRKLLAWLISFVLPKKFVYKNLIKKKFNYDYEIAYLEGVPTKLMSESTAKHKYAWVHTDMSKYYCQEKVFKDEKDFKACYGKFDKVIFVSKSAKEGFLKQFKLEDDEKYIIKHNTFDSMEILRKAQEEIDENLLTENKVVVSVGRLVPQKAYDRLLEVHKRLIDEGYAYDLWIIGGGPEEENLQDIIAKKELHSSVKLLGYQENPYKFMSKADLFVSSSNVEGFCLVGIEAMICGLPIVLTDVGVARELMRESQGGKVVSNSLEGIYEGLKEVLSSDDKLVRYREKLEENINKVLAKFSIEEIEKIFEE